MTKALARTIPRSRELRNRKPHDKEPRGRERSHQAQRRLFGVALLALLVPAALAAGAGASRAGRARAQAARTLNAVDTAHLHFVRSSGSLVFEEGSVAGTIPGSMRASANIGPTVSGSFTIYTRNGSIKGRGTAISHSSGIYESFGGTLVATGGSGRYAHVHGHGGLYGVFNRKTYDLTVQTTGQLSY
jgi:hypothetical protein